METEAISQLEFNHHNDQWWNGRSAVLLENIENMHGHSLESGEKVTIVKKRSCTDQNGVVHKNSFLIQATSGSEYFSVPCTMLALLED
ncbi:MAG TPA: hypothetical protein ENH91_07755 [Leeuwenhoekiella sp.]|nr:hypothetical protein [Leeuwenhoekiella sp.]